jgi:Lon protease-like protein
MVTRAMGMFPLSTVLFPLAGLPLHVFEDRYRRLMADCLDGDGEFGVVLIARGSEVGGGDQRLDLGTVARISHVGMLEEGGMLVIAQGIGRVRVVRWLEDDPYPRAEVEDIPSSPGTDMARTAAAAETSVRRLRSLLSELGDVPALPHDLVLSERDEELCWQLCELAPLTALDRQNLLASDGLQRRLELLVQLCDDRADDVIGLLGGGLGG